MVDTTLPQERTLPQGQNTVRRPASFLQDDNGNQSCMRLMSVIGLLSAIAFSVGIFWQTSHPISGQQSQSTGGVSDEFLIVLSFLSVSFGGKVIQKFAENAPAQNK